jgi:nucleotidyltransferase substrate binding protein (TIGR01987 family)
MSQENAVPLVLDSLYKSVAALKAVLSKTDDEAFMSTLDEVAQNAVKAGVVQHFEFTYELCWKSMKRWIETNVSATEVDGVTRRELFRQAAEQRLIDDVEQWMRYHAARNRTSHMYEPVVAESVYRVTRAFLTDAESLLEALIARND